MVIYLVGTCHLDLKGPSRLKKFLNFVRPSSIWHESSEENAKRLLQKRSAITQKFLNAAGSSSKYDKFYSTLWFIYGYELWAPYSHQQENPTVSIYPLENHKIIESVERTLENDLQNFIIKTKSSSASYRNRDPLLMAYQNLDLQEVQKFADGLYFEPLSLDELPYFLTTERDILMEEKIRKIAADDLEGTTAIICGAAHFFGGYHNLYERLRDLPVCRVRLPEVDKF